MVLGMFLDGKALREKKKKKRKLVELLPTPNDYVLFFPPSFQ